MCMTLTPYRQSQSVMTLTSYGEREAVLSIMRRRACPRCHVSKFCGDPQERWRVVVPSGRYAAGWPWPGSGESIWYARSLVEACDLAVKLHRERFGVSEGSSSAANPS